MANVDSTTKALADALGQVPEFKEGGHCVCVFSVSSEWLEVRKILTRAKDSFEIVERRSVFPASLPFVIGNMAGESSCPVFLCKRMKNGPLRRLWQLVAADLTPALINGERVEVGFNPT